MADSDRAAAGPWRVINDDGLQIRSEPLLHYSCGRLIARVVRATDGQANARLLAAAPELRDALAPLAEIARLLDDGAPRLMSDDIALWSRQSTMPDQEYFLTVGMARAARAALAKAGVT